MNGQAMRHEVPEDRKLEGELVVKDRAASISSISQEGSMVDLNKD